MKFRKLILATVLFLATGSFAQTEQNGFYIPPEGEPKNIILILADGVGMGQLTAGLMMNKGNKMLESFRNIGLMKTESANNLVTDEAAAGTAIAIGKKTNNGNIGVDENVVSSPSLFDVAIQHKMGTALISTASLTSPLTASFLAHRKGLISSPYLALDICHTKLNFIMGAGLSDFYGRSDKLNLLDTMELWGYQVENKLKRADKIQGEKIAGIFEGELLPANTKRKGYLEGASVNAIKQIITKQNGYLMVVEQAHTAVASSTNDPLYVTSEMEDLNKTLEAIMSFVPLKETLIIVVSPYDCGAMFLNGGIVKKKIPSAAWGGKTINGNMTPVFATGPGASQFSGIIDNTDVFRIINDFIKKR